MTTTLGIFILADPPEPNFIHAIKNSLLHAFNPTLLGPWALDHRLFRSTPATVTDKSATRFQYLLRLAHHPRKAYIGVSSSVNAKDAVVPESFVSIPVEQYESSFSLLTTRFSALWLPRSHLQVIHGAAYAAGEFTIRVGELRLVGGPHPDRGTVCFVETTTEQDEAGKVTLPRSDAAQPAPLPPNRVDDIARVTMTALSAQIGFEGASRAMFTSFPADDTSQSRFAEARLWCDILSSRT